MHFLFKYQNIYQENNKEFLKFYHIFVTSIVTNKMIFDFSGLVVSYAFNWAGL